MNDRNGRGGGREEEWRMIGARIRSAREAVGLSGRALAGKVGLSPTVVSKFETGRSGCAPDTLRRIAEATGRSVAWLLGEAEEPDDIRRETVDADPLGSMLGEMIRERRRQRGLTQADVAAHGGCSEALICLWERGERLPRGKALSRVLEFLGLNLPTPWILPDWLQVDVPTEWPPGLMKFVASDRATRLRLTPAQVPLLAAMFVHDGGGAREVSEDVWGLLLLSLKALTGDPRGTGAWEKLREAGTESSDGGADETRNAPAGTQD